MPDTLAPARAHSLSEDCQALLIAPLFVALGVVFFRQAGLFTGGTAGLAFLLHYASGWRFGLLFFLINLPFYAFALHALGARFTIKTFIAVLLLALYSEFLPLLISISTLDPVFAALMGGLLVGIGLLILIRHRASLGGLGVLAIWLQERYGIRAGKVQMGADCCIVLSSCFMLDAWLVALSVMGALALNMVIAVNHKPGRYMGV